EIQPRNVEVWLRLAYVHDQFHRRKEAVESYQKAISLEPAYYETYEEYGVFYYRRGEYSEAAAQFRKAIEYAPGFFDAYTNLGATLSDMGQDAAAEQALLASLQIKETARALNSLAAIRAYQKRDAAAILLYKRSFALDSSSYICLMNLADSSRRQGLAAESLEDYRRGSALAQKELQNNPSSGYT